MTQHAAIAIYGLMVSLLVSGLARTPDVAPQAEAAATEAQVEQAKEEPPQPAAASAPEPTPEPEPQPEPDWRTNEGKRAIISAECEGTRTDWRLVYAIGRHESGNWKHTPGGFNFWGRTAKDGGWMRWGSFREASRDMCEYIDRVFIARGLNTPKEMNHVQSRRYATDPNWHVAVSRYLAELN